MMAGPLTVRNAKDFSWPMFNAFLKRDVNDRGLKAILPGYGPPATPNARSARATDPSIDPRGRGARI
jgi:hypothetical protein